MSTTSLHRYRLWCETEQQTVFVWAGGDDVPEHCPNDLSHTIDPNGIVIVESIEKNATDVSNLPLTPFDRVLVSEETVVVDCKPGMGLSDLRDRVVTKGNASVSSAVGAPEYTFQLDGAGSSATLRTVERGSYVSGLCAEVGIGGRLGTMPVGDQHVRFGAYDDVSGNGYFFEITAPGLSVVVMKDGTETHRAWFSEFNIDQMDGTGPSRLVLDPSRGYVWTIRYVCFGYGCVEFAIAAENIDLKQHVVPMHRYYARKRPSTSCAYLPMYVSISSPTATEPLSCYVTGRKHAVLGKHEPDTRDTCACGNGTTSATQGVWAALFAVRRKPACFAPVTIASIDCWASGDSSMMQMSDATPVFVEIISCPRSSASASQSSWGDVDGVGGAETALEYCANASDINNELDQSPSPQKCVLWRGYAHSVLRTTDIHAIVAEDRIVAVRTKSTTSNAQGGRKVSACLRVQESW